MNNVVSNNTAAATTVTFTALPTLKGKVAAVDKVRQHLVNGVEVGALLSANVGRKAVLAEIARDGEEKTVHALASGNIRPATALVVAVAGSSVTLMEVGGKAPYSEWLRLGANLMQMPQITKAGKPTKAAKALAIWENYTDKATALRAAREKRIS